MTVQPPRWADRLLGRILPKGDWGAGVRGDLLQEYWSRVRNGHPWSARYWFATQTLSVAWCAVRDRRRGHAWGARRRPEHFLHHQRTSSMHLTGLGAELRQTIRGLLKRPARTALVVVTLAAGIAATTTIYTVVDAVILRPLPYADSDRLVNVGMLFPDREWQAEAPGLQQLAGVAVPNMVDWRERLHTFETLEAVEHRSMLFPDQGNGPEIVSSAYVTEGFMPLIGAQVALGRSLQPSDFVDRAPAVAVIAHHTWMARYGGESDVIGQVEGLLTIVGVLTPDLVVPEAVFPSAPEFWTPLFINSKRYPNRERRTSMVIGQLKEGVTVDTARTDLASVQAAVAEAVPQGNVFPDGKVFGAGVNSLQAATVGTSGRPLGVFFGAAVLLLLIATMNSTNLLLLRSLEREGEVALRRALGANRTRLIAGLLLEGVVLAVAAGLIGILLAQIGVAAFLQVGPSSIPRLGEVALNGRVLGISALVSLGAGLCAALWPALRLARSTNLGTGMRDVASSSITTSGAGLRTSLVIVQLAAAVVLGIGASLLLNALVHVSNQDLGFEPAGLTAMSVPLKFPGSLDVAPDELWDRAIAEAATVAGLEHVAAASDPPFADPSWAPWLRLQGDAPDTRLEGVVAFVVTPTFFETVGTALRAGRDFVSADTASAEPVVIVNQAFVTTHLQGRDPLLTSVAIRGEGEEVTVPRRIVGVVDNVVQRRVEDAVAPAVYVPYRQTPWPHEVNVMVRSTRSGPEFNAELRQAMARFSPVVPVLALYPMTSVMDRTLVEPQFRAGLFAALAGISMLLALIGLYGSLSHTVGRRTRELGVRMALGADRRAMFAMVLKQGAMVAAAGLAIGLTLAALAAGALRGFLYGVDPLDPTTFAVTAVGLAAVALLAAWSPARRAARVDVIASLRE